MGSRTRNFATRPWLENLRKVVGMYVHSCARMEPLERHKCSGPSFNFWGQDLFEEPRRQSMLLRLTRVQLQLVWSRMCFCLIHKTTELKPSAPLSRGAPRFLKRSWW
ncbi:hypothetical protein KC19_9G030500 [Ceratodon purpureus]|uniref:Uncharacterized protein n=1 Tax=Ceratodon purpureus TaxID=3225 RepID=A0A8T0GVR9_CERPU|nr:hypothetical protein KC19_9G030500 [Ceratodon purpureus]